MAKKKRTVRDDRFPCPHCGTRFSVRDLSDHLDTTACGAHLRETLGQEFTKLVEVNDPTKEQQSAREQAVVCVSPTTSQTALRLRTSDAGMVTYIPHTPAGFRLERLEAWLFDLSYRPQPEYPPGRCARLFVQFAQLLGATTDAIVELRGLVDVSADEQVTAEQRLGGNKAPRKATKVVATKSGPVKVEVTKSKRNSAAEMFRGLILEGQLTDDEILAKVKEVWDGNKDKSHVSYYRSQLRKQGLNPPPRVKARKKDVQGKRVDHEVAPKERRRSATARPSKRSSSKKKSKKRVVRRKR